MDLKPPAAVVRCVLKAHIELAADGLIDEPSGRPAQTTAARLDLLLLEGCVAWRALRPGCHMVVAFVGHCHTYELVGRLFVKALEEFGAMRQLVMLWLPSSVTGETTLIMDGLGMRWG